MSVAASCKQTMTAGCRDGYIFQPVPGPNSTAVVRNAKTLMLVRIFMRVLSFLFVCP